MLVNDEKKREWLQNHDRNTQSLRPTREHTTHHIPFPPSPPFPSRPNTPSPPPPPQRPFPPFPLDGFRFHDFHQSIEYISTDAAVTVLVLDFLAPAIIRLSAFRVAWHASRAWCTHSEGLWLSYPLNLPYLVHTPRLSSSHYPAGPLSISRTVRWHLRLALQTADSRQQTTHHHKIRRERLDLIYDPVTQ